MAFPTNFTWGVASASYQIEGAVAEDGKGPSVWDMFCRKEGAIWKNQTGDIACDHYHRWQDDVRLMKELGVKAYRFSIAWPRVLPEGVGAINEKGMDFYSRLVDALLAAGITPWITLFHWDYPLALYQRGGWLNRDSAGWFADYATIMGQRLGDRVKHWMTLNEPQCFIVLGHQTAYHAPGDKLSWSQVLRTAHHALLAHGKGVAALRAAVKESKIGIAMVAGTHMPASESKADIEAARSAMFSVDPKNLFNSNTVWFDSLLKGKYPREAFDAWGADAFPIQPGDMETIGAKLDFLGLNIYHGIVERAGADGKPEVVPLPPGYPKTTQDFWPVLPSCLYWGPRFHYERYRVPIVITENGHQNPDVISLDGKVHDPQRIDYLHRHLRELKRASRDGIPIEGYLYWCFTDNFEWAMGDAIRCGIVYTDYPTQQRIPKDSASWYGRVIATNASEL